MITVSEIMTRSVKTLDQNASVGEAFAVMAKGHFRHLPIVDTKDKLVGLVSHRDLLRAGVEQQETRKLSEIMTTKLITAHPSDSLHYCGTLLLKHRFGCVPVVEGKELVGIITDTDFVAVAVNLIELQEPLEEAI